MSKSTVNIFWFRRDLRWQDNTGLNQALASEVSVVPIFIFDREILDKLLRKDDARVTFMHLQLQRLQKELQLIGGELQVYHGTPLKIFKQLSNKYLIDTVFCNHDYEPYAKARDATVASLLERQGTKFRSFKDQVIFEKSEVVKPDGKPYTVFTPYMRKWKEKFHESGGLGELLNKEEPTANWHPDKGFLPSLEQIGFTDNGTIEFPEIQIDPEQLQQYHKTRDFPGLEGTTKLGVHLRFGTVSIRKLVDYALANNETFLNELIWREFYMMILWHFPQVVTESFRPAYDRIPWRNETADFDLWCQGNTGFPMVDAGMRELNATGYMHNRVRMVVASFLTKHLLIDWRWGEAYFAEKLLDFELASNNGGWQWAAGCGCDAAPYFRVFNPSLQAKKFDPDSEYINKWVPEWNSEDYQQPMVNHSFARKRAIETYKGALTEF